MNDAARQRGDTLRIWMAEHTFEGRPVSQAILARLTGLGPSIVAGMMARTGHVRDIGAMQARSVARLIGGMRLVDPTMTGERAAEMFKVLAEFRARWAGAERREIEPMRGEAGGAPRAEKQLSQRTMVSAPEPTGVRIPVMVTEPLLGVMTAPVGWQVDVDPDLSVGEVLWLVRGRLWAMPTDFGGALGWLRLGGIVSLSRQT